MLTLPKAVLTATFEQFRSCGDGQRECVAYWCADTATPDVLARVVHPDHTATDGGYAVDDAWVMQFFVSLNQRQETARVQIHTHPRRARPLPDRRRLRSGPRGRVPVPGRAELRPRPRWLRRHSPGRDACRRRLGPARP